MQLVKPTVNLITLDKTLPLNIALMKKIEKCGRIAYKSENNITEDSYKQFLKTLVSKRHYSVLEHSRIRLTIDITESGKSDEIKDAIDEIVESGDILENDTGVYPFLNRRVMEGAIILTGNLRAFLECAEQHVNLDSDFLTLSLIKYLAEQFPPIFGSFWNDYMENKITSISSIIKMEEDPGYKTFHVVTDRGVMAEWTRHRYNTSFTVESTRYCNYKRSGVTFCIPTPFDWSPSENKSDGQYMYDFLNVAGCIKERNDSSFYLNMNGTTFEGMLGMATNFYLMKLWLSHMEACERVYCEMLSHGCTPQEARAVLPNSLKSEFCVTATLDAWRHFLKLRCAKDAHPQIRYLANQINVIMDHPIYSDSI